MIRALYLIPLLVAPFFSASAEPAASAERSSEKTRPITQISVVALGPKPSRKYRESEGGDAPIMLLAKPGETPPARLFYKGKSKEDKKTAWKPFNVSFNNPSVMKTIQPGKPLSLFRKLPGDEGYSRYITIPAGTEGSRRIFFLTPSTIGPTPWDQPPTVRSLTLTAETFKDKQFILKNLSKFTVLHAFENNVVSVEPSQTISYKRAKSGQLYRLVARYGTQKKIIYNTAVRLNSEGHVQLYVLYNANPRTNSSRSVGVFRTMIPAPPKPQPVPAPTETE